jgi:ABC-type molybdate transport system substrate-binding protein
VFAAASLQGAFTTIGKQFEAAHPGTTVKFSFGPSSGLADQIKSGSPVDVFASASPQKHGSGRHGRRRLESEDVREEHHGGRGAAE